MEPFLLPVFLKLRGRRALLVGGGRVAATKLETLLRTGASVTVVAPEIREDMCLPGVEIRRRPFQQEDLDNAWFVVAAATPAVNRQVEAAAEARRIFVNAADDPLAATAFLGAVIRRADLAVAISTSGRSPALAALLSEAIDAVLPDEEVAASWLAAAEALRAKWQATSVPMPERRPLLLRVLNELHGGHHRAHGHLGFLEAGNAGSLPYEEAKRDAIERFQRRYIEHLMFEADGNVSAAARKANMTRAALHRILKRLGLGTEDDIDAYIDADDQRGAAPEPVHAGIQARSRDYTT
ncbi:MAG: hypothetical protein A3I61_08595 [Acidobacteria bacterium RIFCSPLOWO2_02_FULL_68_18]|nr:MAG: hypothetical protein A3I61_08595 [Acidobacteria bacterium RIFCSPLOWO2_02_FULL_68_18]OFW49826.1 MAG: hypothetical protein A3G77_01390 [Acidobacteria bacterium RIFCSPLOWO2_12_FULL_68_19]